MARGGITQTEVEKARDALLARGVRPSIDAVRIELGNTGSKTTIHRHLQALGEQEGGRLDDEARLSQGLRETVARLAGQLREEAQGLVDEAEARHRAERDALQAQIRNLEQALAALVSEKEGLDASLGDERAAHTEARSALHREEIRTAALSTEKASLEQRLDERGRQIESLEQKHRQAREALEHYRQLSKEQRDQDQRRHASQLQQLQAEIRGHAQALTERQAELTRTAHDNARLAAEIGLAERRSRELEKGQEQAHARIEALLADRARLEAERDAEKSALDAARTDRARLAADLESLSTQLAERTERLHRIEGRLDALIEMKTPKPDAQPPAADKTSPERVDEDDQ